MGRTDFMELHHTRMKAETSARLEFLVGEHVEAFGFFSNLNDFQHVSRHQMSPGSPRTGMSFGRADEGHAARDLPTAVSLVLTSTRVLATSYSAGASDPTPDRVYGAWNRATTSIEVEERPDTGDPRDDGIKITLHLLEEDRPVLLESFDRGSDVNDEILTLLRQ